MVERWWGRDGLSAHAQTDVDVLSTDQGVALDALLGTQAVLVMRMADGGEQQRSGLVAHAQRMGSDGGL
ncbi:contractile injection system protein, VgrG/Pvc8 family, partial [Escherichia coli]|uniref:contractile injection system protein, VgrG/Pvc8 family n=2 Tax=Gammaproteobacteria TaxID=1236 RepID=UPI003B4291EB